MSLCLWYVTLHFNLMVKLTEPADPHVTYTPTHLVVDLSTNYSQYNGAGSKPHS